MSPFLLLLCLSLATYRITRLIISDDLIAGTRMWVLNRILGHPVKDSLIRAKLHYLLRCPYCTSAYVSAAAVVIADQFAIVPLPWLFWLSVWGGSLAIWRFVEQD